MEKERLRRNASHIDQRKEKVEKELGKKTVKRS
jgi:hypothetical protein